MGLFDRGKKKSEGAGLPGTAVIRSWRRTDIAAGETTTSSMVEYGIAKGTFAFDLEVTLDDGRPTYTVTRRFKVPRKLGQKPALDVPLPISADPDNPTRIEIDWDQFIAGGGADEFRAAHRNREQAAVHGKVPSANRTAMVDAWISAAKRGAMTAEQFDETLANPARSGMITAEEAEEAKRAVG
jgi:hypothetical protein